MVVWVMLSGNEDSVKIRGTSFYSEWPWTCSLSQSDGIYSSSRSKRPFSLIPMHSVLRLSQYPWTMAYATSSTEICRVPALPARRVPPRVLSSRWPLSPTGPSVFSHTRQVCGVAPIESRERTSAVLTRRACVRACLAA